MIYRSELSVIIPFRDRGIDPRRSANLDLVLAWWWLHGVNAHVVSDGLDGDAQFNRHRAYNRAVSGNPAEVFVFTEADMLTPLDQIIAAATMAKREPGLVVPFTQYRYLSDDSTRILRDRVSDESTKSAARMLAAPPGHGESIFGIEPESTMEDGRSIGAVNIMSARTLEMTGGFTEATRGNWYDDRIIEEGFAYLTGTGTRFVTGPAVHLYHLPGWKGDHLTNADKAATAHNRNLLVRMRADILENRREGVRDLMRNRA